MRKRRTSVAAKQRQEEQGEKPKAAKRVISEATAAAGGKTAKTADILLKLVMILTRLGLQNARDLAEVTGALLITFLLPVTHIIVTASKSAGDEFNKWREEEKQGKRAKQEMDDDDSDEDKSQRHDGPPDHQGEPLPMPHVHVAVTCLLAALEEKGGNENAVAAREKIKEFYREKIHEKEEVEIATVIKVFRVKRPQKQSKTKGITGQYAKFMCAVSPQLEAPLRTLLMETGGVEKFGKAPRGYLEREASRLLNQMQREK